MYDDLIHVRTNNTDPRVDSARQIIYEEISTDNHMKTWYTENWFKAGSEPTKYEMGIDTETFKIGGSAAYIASKETKIKGFGTLMQSCSAKDYLGKRIKMSGYVKSDEVKGWAGLWLRVDGTNGTKPLAMDNMGDRKIIGTTEWTEYHITLDVPSESTTLNFGALLDGTGKIWFDNITFTIVDNSTKTTGKCMILEKPMNLDFD